MRELDLAWAAGFFDGEGTTSNLKAKRDKYSYLRCSISQKNPELLEKFLAIFKVGKIYKSKTRNIYSWNCYTYEESILVLNQMWPYLGEQKKLQAITADSNKTSTGRFVSGS